jgi:hypothetical protein
MVPDGFFYLEYKKVTGSNTGVRHMHICSLFLGVCAAYVEAPIKAAAQRVKPLVVK